MIDNNDKRSINGVTFGENVRCADFVNLYGCSIGDNTKIGAFVEIQKNVEVGQNCKISSHSFICEGVHIGNGVCVGHGVTFINDIHPRAINNSGQLKTDEDWELSETYIEDGVSIGSGATILGGIRIGRNAVVGAGSVVVKDVPANTTVVGNPAKSIH